jgi:hypothetical protein
MGKEYTLPERLPEDCLQAQSKLVRETMVGWLKKAPAPHEL